MTMDRIRFGTLAALLLLCIQLGQASQDSPLAGLEPAAVWRHFDALLRLGPRCPGKEWAALDYARSVARERDLKVAQDGVGNLVVWRAGSGTESSEPVIVHAHLDMPCPRNDGSDQQSRNKVDVQEDGWLVASGANKTSLGADNGIGAAVALALLELPVDFQLPPLEVLLTVQHEESFLGAWGLNESLLSGRRLINLDAQDYRHLVVGSAGSSRAKINLPITTRELSPDLHPFMLSVKALSGGHSGLDIGLGRANALVLIARAVAALRAKFPRAEIIRMEGGSHHDKIPNEATAEFGLPLADVTAARKVVASLEQDFRLEFGQTDPQLFLRLEQPEHAAGEALGRESAERLLDLLLLLPDGPVRQDARLGQVETSNTVARLRREGPGMLEVLCLARSSMKPSLHSLRDRIDRVAARLVAAPKWGWSFPGWAPDRRSPLMNMAREAFKSVHGHAASITSVHGNMVEAILAEKLPGVDMISVGPDIQNSGTPEEAVRIASVEHLWEFAKQLLVRLADETKAHNVDL